MKIREILRAKCVKRFHTSRFIGEETVASHSWGACVIAIYLCQGRSTSFVGRVLTRVVMHDVPETVVGDVPGNIKASNPHLREQLEVIESRVMKSVFGEFAKSDEEELEISIAKVADHIDLMTTVLDQIELGNNSLNHIFLKAKELAQDSMIRMPEDNPFAISLIEELTEIFKATRRKT